MNKHSIFHSTKSAYSYAYNDKDIHIRIRAKRGEFNKVVLYYGDKFDWKKSTAIDMKKTFSDKMNDYFEISVEPTKKRLAYYFHLEKGDEKVYYTDMGAVDDLREDELLYHYFQYPFMNKADIHVTPDWVRDSVFYQIFPERFNNGNAKINPENMSEWGSTPEAGSFMGGDIPGIIEKLDYLKDLGVTAIYMTPIFTSGSNHKYDTYDYMEIDPAFGTKSDFRELVQKAHGMGMKVVLDAVFNHSGDQFFAFQDVVKNEEKSKYIDWFMINSFPINFEYLSDFRKTHHWSELLNLDIPYETFGYEPLMPKLNTSNKEVQEYLINVVEYWTKEFDVDGWRLDVADEVSNDFWRKFRDRLKQIKEDVYIVGEIWHGPQTWLNGDQYDAVMNYSIMYYCLEYFGYNTIGKQEFVDSISQVLMKNTWQVNEVLLNLLDSHDTARYVTRVGTDWDKLKIALGFLFTFVGAPMIFYGTEIGMEGEHDPDCRRCMEWDDSKWDIELRDYVKKLIKIRKENKTLKRGNFEWLDINDGLVGFTRSFEEEKMGVIINNSDVDKELELEGYSQDLLNNNSAKSKILVKAKKLVILK